MFKTEIQGRLALDGVSDLGGRLADVVQGASCVVPRPQGTSCGFGGGMRSHSRARLDGSLASNDLDENEFWDGGQGNERLCKAVERANSPFAPVLLEMKRSVTSNVERFLMVHTRVRFRRYSMLVAVYR